MNDTKENILLAAIKLFAQDGYEAVSVSRIADALSITKGALYKHYENKRDIFNSIKARMEKYDSERSKEFQMPDGPLPGLEEEYRKVTVDRMIEYSRAQFEYWTKNSFASSFRRMLTLEQYRDSKMSGLYQQYLVSGPLGYIADLFGSMGFQKQMEKAVEFYAPMFLLYSVYDGAEDKSAVSTLLDAHFSKVREES